MRSFKGQPISLSLLVLVFILACAGTSAAQPRDPLQELYKAAKPEKEVVWQWSAAVESMKPVMDMFRVKFPDVKLTVISIGSSTVGSRIITEAKAGKLTVDVASCSSPYMAPILERDLLVKYDWTKILPGVAPSRIIYDNGYVIIADGGYVWAYNTKLVSKAEAPKTLEDTLDPKWKGGINVKTSNSGLQHFTWYMLTKELGAEFWQKLAQQEPRAFDSYVQQYDRLVNGQDKLVECAQYSGFLEFKKKGAPLEFVLPTKGAVAGPEVWGIVDNAPHPNAARLFLDWFLSPVGQKPFMEALFMHSPRLDVPPPPGAAPLSSFKLLYPTDWPDFLGSRPAYLKQWDAMVGRR